MLLYRFVTWITECPFFNFIAGACSMSTLFAIVKFLTLHRKETNSAQKRSCPETVQIIEALTDAINKNKILWIPCDIDDFQTRFEIQTLNVDSSRSFFCFISTNNKEKNISMSFYLISLNAEYRLYGTADFFSNDYRLIASSRTTPKLLELVDTLPSTKQISDDEFLKIILRQIKQS